MRTGTRKLYHCGTSALVERLHSATVAAEPAFRVRALEPAVTRRSAATRTSEGRSIRLARDARESRRFSWTSVKWVTAVSLAAHVAVFAVSLGASAWLITSEIHPLNVCGTAVGVATLSDWTVDLIVAMTFLPLIDGLSRPATFWLDEGPAVVAIVLTRLYMGER
jgi:Sugar (and other) transporter